MPPTPPHPPFPSFILGLRCGCVILSTLLQKWIRLVGRRKWTRNTIQLTIIASNDSTNHLRMNLRRVRETCDPFISACHNSFSQDSTIYYTICAGEFRQVFSFSFLICVVFKVKKKKLKKKKKKKNKESVENEKGQEGPHIQLYIERTPAKIIQKSIHVMYIVVPRASKSLLIIYMRINQTPHSWRW